MDWQLTAIFFVCALIYTCGWLMGRWSMRDHMRTVELQAETKGYRLGVSAGSRREMRKPKRRPYGCRFCNRAFGAWPEFQNHECNP